MKFTFPLNICLTISIFLFSHVFYAQNIVGISAQDHVVDLTKKEWSYVSFDPGVRKKYNEVNKRRDWKPMKVGQRWEVLGHPELVAKTVWVKISFKVPVELKNYMLGFIASMIDDEGAVYLNGGKYC